MLSSSHVAEFYVFVFQIWRKFDKNWRYHDVWKTRETGKTDSEKIDGKVWHEWKLTEYPMWLKMSRMINICDNLWFLLFFHLKIKTTYFSRYKWKDLKTKFFIFD